MQHLYEEMVMWYVINGGQRFISPQFFISDERKTWDCMPDMVALDLTESAIYIIEVNAGGNPKGLAKRIGDNMRDGIKHLRGMLKKAKVDVSSWPVKIRVFVREDQQDTFHKALRKAEGKGADLKGLDIHTLPLENTFRNWTWWDQESGVMPLDGRPYDG